MTHEHRHDSAGEYQAEQLCSLAVAAAIGAVMILLWYHDVLILLLVPKFHPGVIAGGLVLLALVALRALAMCLRVGHVHASQHEHAHECSYQHEHSDGVQDNDWAPWRFFILFLPVELFLLQVPWPVEPLPGDNGIPGLPFLQLHHAADDEDSRTAWQGKAGYVVGKVERVGSDRFRLVRSRMLCCAGDSTPVTMFVVYIGPKESRPDLEFLDGRWGQAIGTVTFEERADGKGWYTVLQATEVKQTRPDPRQYIF